MPHTARKNPKAKPSKRWNVVNKKTGAVVGHSSTKKKAEASARTRDAAAHGWKPTGKK